MTSPSNSKAEVRQKLAGLASDLAGHLQWLSEEGVKQVTLPAGRPVIASAPATAAVAASLDPEQAAARLQAIAATVASCRKCRLHEERTRTVPGAGSLQPDIMFVGEGPGEEEDKQGIPFVGRAGQLLTRLITRMGYTRESVFIGNIVKCRPPKNRKPQPDEMAACLPYLRDQMAVIKPRVIVALGATALEGLVPGSGLISRARGKWLTFASIPLMPTFHPSYLLRNRSAMWDVWHDMEKVLEKLGTAPPARPG